jgi:hypothetical protein
MPPERVIEFKIEL